MQTFAIHTLGCKVNSYESQSMCDDFKAHGYEEVRFQDLADIYIIHTCAVTNTAAQKSRQKVRQAIKANPNATICVVGCYVQTNAEELLKLEGVDVLIGSSGKQDIVSLVEEAHNEKAMIDKEANLAGTTNVNHSGSKRDLNSNPQPPTFTPLLHLTDVRKEAFFEGQTVIHFDHQVRAYLKVQDGCNQFCSYCIIPYTRGKERSLNPDKVVALAKEMVEKGHQEIVLAGIHTGRYGMDHNTTLVSLLERLLKEVPQLQRLRLSSIEANEVSPEMIALFAREERLARHLHIPLQSGEDTTLASMNRKYDTKEFLSKLEEIRFVMPNVSISSDVIVGFPGESREDFERTVAFIKQCKLSFLHVFPYSKRQNTVAARRNDQVEEAEKKLRVQELTLLSKELKRQYHAGFVHKEVQVLFEQSLAGMHSGHSSEYIKISAHKPSRELRGKLVEVIIDSYDEEGCYGRLA